MKSALVNDGLCEDKESNGIINLGIAGKREADMVCGLLRLRRGNGRGIETKERPTYHGQFDKKGSSRTSRNSDEALTRVKSVTTRRLWLEEHANANVFYGVCFLFFFGASRSPRHTHQLANDPRVLA